MYAWSCRKDVSTLTAQIYRASDGNLGWGKPRLT